MRSRSYEAHLRLSWASLLYAGTWFVQRAGFGHVTYSDSVPTLIGAGLLTPLAAVVAGFAVAFIAGTRPNLHLVPMCALIVAETAFLYSRGLVDGPIWFEASAGLSLILGAIGGAYLWRYFLFGKSSNTAWQTRLTMQLVGPCV